MVLSGIARRCIYFFCHNHDCLPRKAPGRKYEDSWPLLRTLEVEVSKGIKTRFYFWFQGQILNCEVSNPGLACENSYVVWKFISKKKKIGGFKKKFVLLKTVYPKRAPQSLVSWAHIAIKPITDVYEKVTQDKQIQNFECY